MILTNFDQRTSDMTAVTVYTFLGRSFLIMCQNVTKATIGTVDQQCSVQRSSTASQRAHDVGTTSNIGCTYVATSVNVHTTSLQSRVIDVVRTSKIDVVRTLI